jgi:hypothetical protein
MVAYDERIYQLLRALGISYEKAMIELTTLPYWLAFDSFSLKSGMLPGTKHTPRLRSPRGGATLGLSRRGIASSNGQSVSFRYCPKCLGRDHTTNGEPYWHRAHQLPNVFFCHYHNCALGTACPECGLGVSPKLKRLISLPPLRCQCGFDLRRVPHQGSIRRHIRGWSE